MSGPGLRRCRQWMPWAGLGYGVGGRGPTRTARAAGALARSHAAGGPDPWPVRPVWGSASVTSDEPVGPARWPRCTGSAGCAGGLPARGGETREQVARGFARGCIDGEGPRPRPGRDCGCALTVGRASGADEPQQPGRASLCSSGPSGASDRCELVGRNPLIDNRVRFDDEVGDSSPPVSVALLPGRHEARLRATVLGRVLDPAVLPSRWHQWNRVLVPAP